MDDKEEVQERIKARLDPDQDDPEPRYSTEENPWGLGDEDESEEGETET